MTNPSTTPSEGYSFSLFTLPLATTAVAYGINDLGEVTGTSSLGAFIDNNGNVTQVEVPFSYPVPLGINNLGQVVGAFPKSDGDHAFIDTNGSITYVTSLPSEPVNDAKTAGINDLGQVVGSYTGYSGSVPETILVQFGFIDNNGTLTHLALKDGTGFLPSGINDFDKIAGTTTTGVSGVLDLRTETFNKIAVPGAQSTDVTAINNLGQAAGTYTDSAGAVHGFVDTGGHFTFLNLPTNVSGTLEGITAINDLGQVVGNFISNGVTESFIATPDKIGGLLSDLIPALPAAIKNALPNVEISPGGSGAVNVHINAGTMIPLRFGDT